jgi:RNA 3'-terminal phosphate cyclase (ATP)
VGEYLTDQLMLPLALAGQGEFVSTGLSRHAETHLALIREFLNVRVETQRCDGGVRVRFG